MAKSSTVTALDFLAAASKYEVKPVCAVYGDEAFLKREVLTTLRALVLGGNDCEFSLKTVLGKNTEWRDVRDALAMVSLFGSGQPLVIVEEADPFVTRYRSELEDYAAKPSGGVLVLEVKSWPGNTRLAKAVAKLGLPLECKAPNEGRAKRWLAGWAKRRHRVQLDVGAADALWDLLPPELGILQQEVDKLAPLTSEDKTITLELVQQHVGGWRTRTTWEMIDAVACGDASTALEQLDRLITSGEQPIGLLGQMAATLRRLATATQVIEQAERAGKRVTLRSALQRAGFRSFKLAEAERQLRQLGRGRAQQLHQWLLSADLAMKSHNSDRGRARIELESLIGRLSVAAASKAPSPARNVPLVKPTLSAV